MLTATLKIASEQYRDRGVTAPGQSHNDWAQEFIRRGGLRCRITRPKGVPAGQSPDHMLVSFEGSAHALEMLTAVGCYQ